MDDNDFAEYAAAVMKIQQMISTLMETNQQQADGTRAAIMAIAYALSKQPALDPRKLYSDAAYAINDGFEQGDAIPTSATEFLAQLHEALSR